MHGIPERYVYISNELKTGHWCHWCTVKLAVQVEVLKTRTSAMHHWVPGERQSTSTLQCDGTLLRYWYLFTIKSLSISQGANVFFFCHFSHMIFLVFCSSLKL